MQARDELTERLVAWARNLKFREATKKEGAVPAETLCTAARADLGLVGNDLDGFELCLLRALDTVCGVVVRPKREPRQASVWGVTCDTYQASSLVAAATSSSGRPVVLSNKKERRQKQFEARRLARGLPASLDPTRHRAIKMEKGVTPHFTRYTDELLSLASAPTLLELRLFPNAKELTESFSIFNAARAYLTDKEFGFDFSDPAVTVIAVGDGYTPRTAALFGFRTKWRCVSVDPLMTTPSEWEHKVQRLAVHRARFQDVHDEAALTGDRVLLVLPHAHISVGECIRRVRWRSAIAAVVIPCCDNYAISAATGPPMFEEEDGGVVSPHRLVRIWRWTRNHELPPGVPSPLPAAKGREASATITVDQAVGEREELRCEQCS